VTQPPPASPHSGKRCISSAWCASADQPRTPTGMLSLFRSFIFASLPLSHAVTPHDAVTPLTDHWPPALFLSSPVLQFSLSFFLSLFSDSLLLYSCTTSQQFVFVLFFYLFLCFTAIFFFLFLLLVSVISTHTQYIMSMSLSITWFI
jgi:hypothetical protein